MAKSLSAFLAQNAAKVENKHIAISTRFRGENGEPVKWELTSITATENQRLRRDSTRNVPTGKRGQFTQEFDMAQYQARLATKCVVYPDLNDAALQESYGALSAEQLISAMLTPGEFDDLFLAIADLNGFNSDADLVEEAKN